MPDPARLLEEARRAARGSGDPELDDLVQETLVRVWERLQSTGNTDRTSRLVQTTMRHLRIDRWRKARPLASEELDGEVGGSAGPFEDAVCEERIASLRAQIEALPPEQREVVHMRYFEGRTFREVAELQGVPLGTALGRMHLAVRRLRRELEQHDG